MKLRTVMGALAISSVMGLYMPSLAAEPPAEQIELKDGSTLYLHPDGTSRMVDQHGKRIDMRDGVPMETKDGRIIMMENKRIWVQYGPPGKGGVLQKVD